MKKKMERPFLASTGLLAAAVYCVLVLVLSACSPTIDGAADATLGPDCSDEARVVRADMLTDLAMRAYGREGTEGLYDALDLMLEAKESGQGMEEAARVYQVEFLIWLSSVAQRDMRSLEREGWIGIYRKFREQSPLVAEGVARIKARMAQICPDAPQDA